MRKTRKRRLDYRKIESELASLERRLVAELHHNLDNVRNASTGTPTEFLDIAAQGEIDYLSAVSAEAGSATLDEVHHALRKLREGTYGICENCHRPIAQRRLKARPSAVLCIHCKEREERRGLRRGRGTLAARRDAAVSMNLNDEDMEPGDAPADDVFRSVEDVEIGDLY